MRALRAPAPSVLSVSEAPRLRALGTHVPFLGPLRPLPHQHAAGARASSSVDPRGNSVRPPNTHGPHHVLLQLLPCGPARLDRQLCSHSWFGGTRRAGLVESARRALHLGPSGRTALAPGWGAVIVRARRLPVEGPLLGGKGQARAGVGEAQGAGVWERDRAPGLSTLPLHPQCTQQHPLGRAPAAQRPA